MSRHAIQFQKGLSLREFKSRYGNEAQCEAAPEEARGRDGFRCLRCGGSGHGLVYGRRVKRCQCQSCGHQATLTTGTIMEATKLPLAVWFLGFYIIGQAKTGIFSLELNRHLGVPYNTAWQLHKKILRAMTGREEAYFLRGKIQIDDAYLGGERLGGKVGQGSENKVPIHAKVTPVSGFSSGAIKQWASKHLANCCALLSDGLACFRSVVEAGCSHETVVT